MCASGHARNDELAYWLRLAEIEGIGSATFCQLLRTFGTPQQIFDTPLSALKTVVSPDLASRIKAAPDTGYADTALTWLQASGNHILTFADSNYPQALLQIPDPPPILYAKGYLECLSMPGIAVVGSRNATVQGEKNAEAFAQALAELGFCIISGMALGIDGAAHRGALRVKGATVAVVGTGLDIVYPARHRGLAHEIVTSGLMLSEFPLGTPSIARNFPRRNRMISGLSLGCLVVEANLQSGSLITARLAAEQGREVFAIPGSIHSPLSKGCHQLIKDGAKLVDDIQDIASELSRHMGDLSNTFFTTEMQRDKTLVQDSNLLPEQQKLLTVMGFDPVNLDELLKRSGLTSEQLSAMLLVLDLAGKVTSLPGGRFQQIA